MFCFVYFVSLRIQNPEPYYEVEYGSRRILNTDSSQIQIHITAFDAEFLSVLSKKSSTLN